jgi:D-lactate dehydrogenase (cytochrome)
MDMTDLFIGSEGTLGVFTELELQLLPEPPVRWCVTAFFPDQRTAVDFAVAARATGDLRLAAIEFFDERSLNLLRRERETLPAIADLPELPVHFHTAIYVEIHAQDEDDALAAAELLLACGVNEENIWIAASMHDLEKVKAFRHALPETVNRLIDERRRREPSLTKLGTDMAVPDEHLFKTLERYTNDLNQSGLDYVIFGHIGNNHLHVNLLPYSLSDYQQGRELYHAWAQEVIRLGGTVSAEHGIGKLKAPMLELQFGEKRIHEMRNLKRIFDPEFRLNQGNLFK